MFKVLSLTSLLLITATGAQAQDSTRTASAASDESVTANAHLSEAGVKVVAGTVSIPLIVGGAAISAPGLVIDASGDGSHSRPLSSVGFVAATPGLAMVATGFTMMQYANSPLDVSSETVVAQRQTKPH